jgi:hypothetical protein
LRPFRCRSNQFTLASVAKKPFSYALRRLSMYSKNIALTAAFILSASTAAFAQSRPADHQTNGNSSSSVTQPQGKTGPINTEAGGAPASSPQGDTPAGMQPVPKGSIKKIENDNNRVPKDSSKK